MEEILKKDSLFNGLKRNLAEIGDVPDDILILFSPDFWISIDPSKLSVNSVYSILSMHFKRTGVLKGNRFKTQLSSDLGIDQASPFMKFFGLIKGKCLDCKYGLYLPRNEVEMVLESCFNVKGWSKRVIRTIFDKIQNKCRNFSGLGREFILESLFIHSKFCPSFVNETHSDNSFKNCQGAVHTCRAAKCFNSNVASGSPSSESPFKRVKKVKKSNVSSTSLTTIHRSTKLRMKKIIAELKLDNKCLGQSNHNLRELNDSSCREIECLKSQLLEREEKVMTLAKELQQCTDNLHHALCELDDFKACFQLPRPAPRPIVCLEGSRCQNI